MYSTRVGLRKVIRLVIETGTITGQFSLPLLVEQKLSTFVYLAAVAILNLILINITGTSYYLVPSEILAKIYSNSMMVVLNSRMRIGVEKTSSEQNTTIQRVRTDIPRTTDAYELGEGVMITREEVVFPSGHETSKIASLTPDKGYYV